MEDSSPELVAWLLPANRESLNDREGQPVYTYISHLVDPSALYKGR